MLAFATLAQASDRPNIIFIITDDHDHDTMGCFGGPVPTPHIDALAADGVRFQHFTTTSPVCTPTRFTCLSGRYASRAEKMQRSAKPGEPLAIGWQTNLETDKPNLQKVLSNAGYRTGMVGKWHLGGLTDEGLDVPQDYGPESSLDDPTFVKYLKDRQALWSHQMREKFGFDFASRIYKGNIHKKNRSPDCIGFHNMEWVVEGAQDFIRQSKDQPFFLYMATTVPHGPQPLPSLHADVRICGEGMLDAPPNTGMPSRESVLQRAEDAGLPPRDAWIYWLDDGIGAIRRTVEELGLLENTIIVIMSDQEAAGKGSLYDRGVGAPCIASWKGTTTPGTVSDAMAQNIDLAPTFFDLAEAKAPKDMVLDGKSFAPLLRGEELADDWRSSQYFEIGLMRAVRTRDWKYIAFRLPEGMEVDTNAKLDGSDVPMFNQFKRRQTEFPHWWDADQLYDLRTDSMERTNLATSTEHAEKLAELKSLLAEKLGELPYDYAEFAQSLPSPPDGFRWEPVAALTDEFNGKELDRSKWHDHNPNWVGRPPGKFKPSSVTVQDGKLHIQLKPLVPAEGEFNIAAGTIQSKQKALYGYYECRMKASQLSASSNFWFVSDDIKLADGMMKQELIAQFTIGKSEQHKDYMKSNAMTAFKANADDAVREKAKATDRIKLPSSVSEDFHTYGLWWVDANTLKFYVDGEYAYTIHPPTKFHDHPFQYPLSLNLICETFDWQPLPTDKELNDDTVNTALVDYVRSYRLVNVTSTRVDP